MAFKVKATSGILSKRYLWLGADFGQSIRVWVYVTTDTPGTVAGSGYITDTELLSAMRTGDFLLSLQVGAISDSREVYDDVATGGLSDLSLHVVESNDGSTLDLSSDMLSTGAGTGDVSTSGNVTSGNVVTYADGTGDSIQDGGYAPSDKANSAITLTAGDGLTGGGDLSANRSFALDINGLTDASAFTTGDKLVIYEDGVGIRKIDYDDLPAGGSGSGIASLVEDTTPQLGGALDVNGQSITSATNGNVTIDPHGTGNINLGAANVTIEQDLIHAGDTNNKIVFGTDTQDFQTGGSSRMDISDSGVRFGGAGARITTTTGADTKLVSGTAGTSGNLAQWNGDGDLVDSGSAISDIYGKQSLWIPANAMTARTTSGAASGTSELATNDVMLETFDFDASSDEFVQFTVAFPKSWDAGTVTAQFFWTHPSTATNFGVAWAIQARAFANSDALDTAFGTAIVTTDTGGTTNDLFVTSESSAVTIAGSPGDNELCIFQIFRDVSDGSDSMAVDAKLIGIKLFYTTDALNDA